jgi:cytochrome c biogenesis protein CcmG/thiol:disulfide interchange protein DsbE
MSRNWLNHLVVAFAAFCLFTCTPATNAADEEMAEKPDAEKKAEADDEPCVTEADKPANAKPEDEPCITDDSKATDFKQPRRMWASSYLWAKAPDLVVEEWLTDEPDTKGKYVLIEFWATWCPPCRRSLPLLNGFHEKFGDELVVIGISHEPAKEVLALNDKHPEAAEIKFHSAIDTKARMKKKLGVWGIPHAILLEPDGYVIWEGFPLLKDYELTEDIIRRALDIGRKLKAAEEKEVTDE